MIGFVCHFFFPELFPRNLPRRVVAEGTVPLMGTSGQLSRDLRGMSYPREVSFHTSLFNYKPQKECTQCPWS